MWRYSTKVLSQFAALHIIFISSNFGFIVKYFSYNIQTLLWRLPAIAVRPQLSTMACAHSPCKHKQCFYGHACSVIGVLLAWGGIDNDTSSMPFIKNSELHFWKMYVVIPPLPAKLITPFEMVNVTGHYPNDQSRGGVRSLHYIWKAASPVLPIQPVLQGSNIRRNPAVG